MNPFLFGHQLSRYSIAFQLKILLTQQHSCDMFPCCFLLGSNVKLIKYLYDLFFIFYGNGKSLTAKK